MKLFAWVITILLIVFAFRNKFLFSNPLVSPAPQTSPSVLAPSDNPLTTPVINLPVSGSVVTSPVTVTGTVPPGWMFEGQFKVTVQTEDGQVLGTGIAQELEPGSWMNGKDVAFTTSVAFTPKGERGFVVLFSDNPSGDPQRQMSYFQTIYFQRLPGE